MCSSHSRAVIDGKIPVRYGYGFSEHKLHLLQGEFSKDTVPTKFSDTSQYTEYNCTCTHVYTHLCTHVLCLRVSFTYFKSEKYSSQ
jgi:hypothetical protein